MAGFRRPEQPRGQVELFPLTLEESIPLDHPVRSVLAILESPEFRSTIAEMEKEYDTRQGRPSYHPLYLLGLYVYGMYIGIRSTRRLEEACHNRLDVRFLMEDQRPDHSTIADFVNRHAPLLRRVLKSTLLIGKRAKLLRLEGVAIDGTFLKSRAAKKSIKKRSVLKEEEAAIEREINKLEQQFARNEEEERLNPPPVLFSKRELSPEEARSAMEERKAQIAKALSDLDERKSRASRKQESINDSVSVNDPESRGMTGKDGQFGPHYNAQIATDVESGMVVAASVNDEAHDAGLLKPMVDEVIENCEEAPKRALADSAYSTGPDLSALEEAGIEAFVADRDSRSGVDEELLESVRDRLLSGERLSVEEAKSLPRGRNGRLHLRAFAYRSDDDSYICPLGEVLRYKRTQTQKLKGKQVKRRTYTTEDCSECPLLLDCCGGKKPRRMVSRDKHEDAREKARKRLRDPSGKEIYRARSPSVEGRIGFLTNALGLRRATRFGRQGVATEWMLGAIAVNLRVLIQNWSKIGSSVQTGA